MRTITLIFLLLASLACYSQKLANSVEVLGEDSLKLYFSSSGVLIDKECADYFRISKMRSEAYVFDGHSKDYYSSGQLAVECNYSRNLFDGEYRSYYRNGQLKEHGQFNAGQKTGQWKYWYENGQLRKLILFENNDYFLKEFYKPNGKQLVIDGEGEFNEAELLPQTIMRGEIRNGKQHGTWTVINKLTNGKTAIETFSEGRFIEGENIALAQSFSKKYHDYPNSLIDLTKDLLSRSYAQKADCMLYGKKNSYHFLKFNSKHSSLPFYDYIYQSFNPVGLQKGYILVGFTIDKKGKLVNTTLHSTIDDKPIENELLKIFESSDTWQPRTLNGKPVESSLLFVFQFFDGTYKILNDSRNSYPPVEYGAMFMNDTQGLSNYVVQHIKLPKHFYQDNFATATSIGFKIDEGGNIVLDESSLKSKLHVQDEENILYNALSELLQKSELKWEPATVNGVPTAHHFNGVFNIKHGNASFRLFSNSWVLN